MDELTLREKLDAVEACEKLIAYYAEQNNGKAIDRENEYAALCRRKEMYFISYRIDLLTEIEQTLVGFHDKQKASGIGAK